MVKRVFNFNPGPATLPLEVLEEAAKATVEFNGLGMSILEISHRSKDFEKVLNDCVADVKELLGLPDGYSVLFMGGGASTQFAMVPMNFLPAGGSADYINTGEWSSKAIKEAKLFGTVNVTASSEDKKFSYLPDPKAVVVVGNCGASGDVFYKSYNLEGPVDRIIPVDVFVHGCPPRPEAIIEGVAKAVLKLERLRGDLQKAGEGQ
jgi:phosphoserine aminotransferase